MSQSTPRHTACGINRLSFIVYRVPEVPTRGGDIFPLEEMMGMLCGKVAQMETYGG